MSTTKRASAGALPLKTAWVRLQALGRDKKIKLVTSIAYRFHMQKNEQRLCGSGIRLHRDTVGAHGGAPLQGFHYFLEGEVLLIAMQAIWLTARREGRSHVKVQISSMSTTG